MTADGCGRNACGTKGCGHHAGGTGLGGVLMLVAALIVAAVAVYTLLWDSPGGPGDKSAERSELNLDNHIRIAPELLAFEQVHGFPVTIEAPSAIALGPDGRIYVAGSRAVEILDATGRPAGSIALDSPATCMAVAGEGTAEPGRVYVGAATHVMPYGADLKALKKWPVTDEKSVLTAIAVAADDIFVADAGTGVVLRYSADGQMIGRIGANDPDRHVSSFVIPSAHFDLVIDASQETVFVVNPGMRRVESYTFDGQLQSVWGRAGTDIAEFFGCCNPAHLARLPDGRFVTSEKGIPRVKVYSEFGEFESVVAGPGELEVPASALGDARGGEAQRVFDVAVSSSGDVLVLDARKQRVRVFRPKSVRRAEQDT